MEIGRKGKGKHWTQAEVDARREAAVSIIDSFNRVSSPERKPWWRFGL